MAIGSNGLLINPAELRIHEDTERGDNDTVKMPNGQKVVIDGKTCVDR
jgi:complex III assembly factor LYRM7